MVRDGARAPPHHEATSFLRLRLVPQCIHLLQRRAFKGTTLRFKRALDVSKPPLEFRIGTPKRQIGIGADVPREIDKREQEIAGFVGELIGIAPVECGLDLVGLFANFMQHRAGIVPVEADAGGFTLQRHRARQRGLSGLDAREQRWLRKLTVRPPCRAFGFLLGLDALPCTLHTRRRQISIACPQTHADAADHLARDRLVPRRRNANAFCSSASAGVIHHLQQKIAQFFAEIVEIATPDGVGDLIGFLDRVGRDRRKILFEVPRAAAAGRAQLRHDFDADLRYRGRASWSTT